MSARIRLAVLCVLPLLFVSQTATTQPALPPPSRSSSSTPANRPSTRKPIDLASIDRLERSGRGRVNTGTFLAIVGVAGVIGGGLLVKKGQSKNNEDLGETVDGAKETFGGITLISLGCLLAGGGVAAIVSGKDDIAEARRMRRELNVTLRSDGVAFGISGSF